MNKFHFQQFFKKATDVSLDTNLPVLINSKEIIDNYKDVKLPSEVLSSKYSFSPWFIVGFVEAEGNFDISINVNPKVLPKFRFRLSSKYLDIVFLCAIKNYFDSGSLYLEKILKFLL